MLSQLRTEMDTLSGGEKMSKTTWCQNLSTVLSTKKSVLLSWQFNFWLFLQLCTWYTFNVKLYSVEINYCIIVSLTLYIARVLLSGIYRQGCYCMVYAGVLLSECPFFVLILAYQLVQFYFHRSSISAPAITFDF